MIWKILSGYQVNNISSKMKIYQLELNFLFYWPFDQSCEVIL